MAELSVGDEFAGCRIEAVIGRGGMGVVYRAGDLKLQRPVAIKLIAADRAGDAAARRRFEREARMMAAIDHPNVIPVYAAGEESGDLYLVMRYVDGTDLQRRIRREGGLTPGETARVIGQVARALDAAHARGLVHRDIKPANVLLSGEHAYLTDFGITRLAGESGQAGETDTGDWIGTLDFTSPEHLRGAETDARSDVYSLGCVLYACLAGSPPFKRTSTAATITAHLQERPPLASRAAVVPAAFDQIVGRAMAKDPALRYASAGELAAAVNEAAAGRPQRWGRVARRAVAPAPTPRQLDTTTTAATARLAPTAPTRRAGAGRTRPQPVDVVPTLQLGAGARGLAASGDAPGRVRRPGVVAAGALGLVLIAVIALVLGLSGSRARAVTPFSRAQVAAVLSRFAAAYSDRDSAQLAALLAPDVTHLDSGGAERGASAVLSDYRSQFATRPVPTRYVLANLSIDPGWVARASADYTVTLRDGSTLGGQVVFAIQRIGGRTLIGLIVTRPGGESAGTSTGLRDGTDASAGEGAGPGSPAPTTTQVTVTDTTTVAVPGGASVTVTAPSGSGAGGGNAAAGNPHAGAPGQGAGGHGNHGRHLGQQTPGP